MAVRVCFGVPATTHRYLVEPLSGVQHVKNMLCSRLVKFLDQLILCGKPAVNLMAMLYMEDRRTTLGKNIARIKTELKGKYLSCSNIKKHLRYFSIPQEEEWRILFLEELVEITEKKMSIENKMQNL